MASPRTNGRLVWVALQDVHPRLRRAVADRLARQASDPIVRAELLLAAHAPRNAPDGRQYGAYVTRTDALRVRNGLLPKEVGKRRG